MSASVDEKRALLAALRILLEGEVERSTRQARDAADAATHEDNRQEGDKDMRSTEASYIARGQAARVVEIEDSLAKLAAMPLRAFGPGASIGASAVVLLEHDVGKGAPPGGGRRATYFIVTAAGGQRLTLAGREIQTLATTSPLGRALLGLVEGDVAEVKTPQGMREHEIVSVA